MSLNKTKNTNQVIKTISISLKIILMRFTFLHVFFQIWNFFIIKSNLFLLGILYILWC